MREPWPLRHLVLRTPRLELRPVDDVAAHELAAVALGGVHPPAEMPFAVEWTDADPRYLGRGMLQYFWRCRAELTPQRWIVPFVVRVDGRTVGMQELSATDVATLGEVGTGSWLGTAYQRQGLGTEMRAAVLAFAFEHLGARTARSAARPENTASLAVSRRLGYRPDGTESLVRRGGATTNVRLVLDRDGFARPPWTLRVDGSAGCAALLGFTADAFLA